MESKVQKLWNNELIRYIIAGGMVAVFNFVIYMLLQWRGITYLIANIYAIVLSKSIGYILNKYFVYKSKINGVVENLKELFRFVLARSFTGIIDYFGVIFMVEELSVNSVIAKSIVIIIVIVLNYVLGKFTVFNQK